MEIQFDVRKAKTNRAKHGVSFEEAVSALFDSRAIAMEDPDSESETRWVSIGMSDQTRLITMVYTYRNEAIRLISARQSTRREARQYA